MPKRFMLFCRKHGRTISWCIIFKRFNRGENDAYIEDIMSERVIGVNVAMTKKM